MNTTINNHKAYRNFHRKPISTFVYTYECDLGDGWESQEVHNDPLQLSEKKP